MQEADDDNDLLYGDLESSGKDAETKRLMDMLSSELKKNEQYTVEISALKDQIQCLVADKVQLESNIVAIYNTALREMKRKDAEIVQLRGKR